MTDLITPAFLPLDLDALATAPGRIVVLAEGGSRMDKGARRINRLTRGALARMLEGEAFAKLKPGEGMEIAFPTGMEAEALQVLKIDRKMEAGLARKLGGAIGAASGDKDVLVIAGSLRHIDEMALGALLRRYEFRDHKTGEAGAALGGGLSFAVTNPEALKARESDILAVAGGVYFSRDLVNEPANVLSTLRYAERLQELEKLGVKVEVLEEPALEELGMGALLGVAKGSATPAKVVVMQWLGGAKEAAPLALIGKGVVFDSGGISLKPAAGMEEMTWDMGGSGTVAGVMKALALRKAPANVIGIVGLVENMPDGAAQRPGDVVRSMKGDTIEVVNTDAEGRLVLADVLWYAQERFNPAAMVDLATLTGAMVVALGHEFAGAFANDETFAKAFLKAAETEGENVWRMPLSEAFDTQLKSRVADMKNSGQRPGGSITAAQFLRRFVKDETPWIHLDIAGVASLAEATDLAPKGATGWGVRALDRLVRDAYEG